MCRILVERARRRLTAKRGGGAEVLDVDVIELPSPVADDEGLLYFPMRGVHISSSICTDHKA
jgi:hypothetical protein